MRKILLTSVLGICLSSCSDHTQYGKCVGFFDNAAQDPLLIYKPSVRNIVWSIIFSELIAPPVYLVLEEGLCPVGRK